MSISIWGNLSSLSALLRFVNLGEAAAQRRIEILSTLRNVVPRDRPPRLLCGVVSVPPCRADEEEHYVSWDALANRRFSARAGAAQRDSFDPF